MLGSLKHEIARRLKSAVYSRGGEPYEINGHTLRYVPGTRPVRLRYLDSSDRTVRYDALQVKWFADNLKPGNTAIDIGAHYGIYSVLMAAMCGPTGTVVSFEPDPYARKVLMRNIALNPGIKAPIVEKAACSDAAGEATLFSRGGNAQSSLARSAVEFKPEHHSESFTVPLVTLDAYIADNKIPTPNWVKIDPEGAEIRILKGAPRLLDSDAGILCELHPYAWPEFGNSFQELKDIVAAAGRRMRYIDEEKEIGDTPIYGTVLLEAQLSIAVMSPRVIHIVENLDRGAVENWLARMLHHAHGRGQRLDWTFYCALGRPGALDDRVRELGGKIIYSPEPIGRTRTFLRALRAELASGRYEVMHAHHDLISGLYMLAAAGTPVRRKLIHVHNADEIVLTPRPLKQMLLRGPLRRVGLALADAIVGISNHTLDTFLAGRGRRPGRDIVHYYGVETAPFENLAIDRPAFRRQLGLPNEAVILLFGGRLVPEKNPVFAVEVLQALERRLLPNAVLVYAGAGSEEETVAARAQALGLTPFVKMLGWRTDLPAIMVHSDLFILPRPESPMEGLGLAVVEAQLAGLRMLLSRGIADDPLLPSAHYRRLALAAGPQGWAGAAQELLHEQPSLETAFADLARSPFAMDTALDNLTALHRI